ncbi:MAG: thioesterase family protein [Phenylobacterium sp.]|uniref:thioesterase family protein n=1 Tax=Phenylobacterium sp. TaxID=1871053 RepID=UPI001A6415A9|nr:thioesterase family protein [Phenylobacterium sp.]MBL8770657.1 thioesterase family protein [Phenylobacterium sp.]
MPSFREVIAALTPTGAAYEIEAPEGWRQGRTLYGGITAALCAAASAGAHPGLPPLRSAQVALVGPAGGRIRFEPTLLRQGRSATVVSVDATGEAGMAARALFTYGAARESAVRHDAPRAPAVPPPEDCPDYFPKGGFAPGFSGNFEARLASGARPLTPGADPDVAIWVRHAADAGDEVELALLALADVPPPAAMIAFAQPAPISTATWSLDIFQPIGGSAGDWRLLRSTSEQAADGYSLQAMEVFDTAGRRVAAARQLVAIFA